MNVLPVLILCVAAGAAPAVPPMATFDELTEGFASTSFSSGGIHFSQNLWFPGGVQVPFGIDNASATMPALGFGGTFTTPNVMNGGGFVTGPGAGFIRNHTWTAAVPGQTFHQGQADVYYINDFLGATAYLNAYAGQTVVGSDSFTITNPNPFEALHDRLQVNTSVPFDRLVFEVFGGPPGGNADGLLAVFDNVGLDVPAPAAAFALLAPLPLFSRRR